MSWRLELTDVTVVAVDATLVGCRYGALVTSGPLAEHTCCVTVVLHDFGKDNMCRVIRFLARLHRVGCLAVCYRTDAVLLVSAYLCVPDRV